MNLAICHMSGIPAVGEASGIVFFGRRILIYVWGDPS